MILLILQLLEILQPRRRRCSPRGGVDAGAKVISAGISPRRAAADADQ
jgi:hypothetical protein